MTPSSGLVINGWRMIGHPMYLDAVEALTTRVEAQRAKDPNGYQNKAAAKQLAAIYRLSFQDIPANPGDRKYRQGTTLGEDHRRWRRAKFFQQYRLFFRYHETEKVIVLAWVNDESSLRAYGSKKDDT